MEAFRIRLRILELILISSCLFGCVTGDDFDSLDKCTEPEVEITGLLEFTERADSKVTLVDKDVFIRLFVTSSDRNDNIYGAIYLQDHPENPTGAIELKTELRDAYLVYPIGSEVILNLKGLYVKNIKGALQVGALLNNFGNLTLGRLPHKVTQKHLAVTCNPPVAILPKRTVLDSLYPDMQFMYVLIDDLQVAPADLCKPFAESKENPIRNLLTCEGQELEMPTSGYSDFHEKFLPAGKGYAAGILKFRGSKPQVLINSNEDLKMEGQRCDGVAFSCELPVPNSTVSEIKELFIISGDKIEGKVIRAEVLASDVSDNFKGELYLKDETGTIKLLVNKEELYRDGFLPGSGVLIDLGGLMITENNREITIVYPFEESWSPIPEKEIYRVLFPSGETGEIPEPVKVSLPDIGQGVLGEYIELGEMQLAGEGMEKGGFSYVNFRNCPGGLQEVRIPHSMIASAIPRARGSISGILTYENGFLLRPILADDLAGLQELNCSFFIGTSLVSAEVLTPDNLSEPELISENIGVQGIVISDIAFGNYEKNALFLQDDESGLALELTEDHEIKRGSRVRVSLQGGYLQSKGGLPLVSGLFPDQIEVLQEQEMPVPLQLNIQELLRDDHKGKWVHLEPVMFEGGETPLADGAFMGDCTDRIPIRILAKSELAEFTSGLNSGSVSGFYYDGYFIPGRSTDINLNEESLLCDEFTPPGGVIISEIGDPSNSNSELNSRFLELYNGSGAGMDLSGWELRRYTNANTAYTESTVISLNGVYLPQGGVFVLAADADGFSAVYGFDPDLEGGVSTASDSNGDDTIVLVDASGNVVDVFGVPGEDGTGTAHDFEDGKAVRVPGVNKGNAAFDPQEWQVYNAHGAAGTTAQLLNAPLDYNPGSRE